MKWSILVATQGKRIDKLNWLLSILMPQVETANRTCAMCGPTDPSRHPVTVPQVEVVALFNNGEKPLGEYRHALLEAAKGEYVSFVDDDDEVSPKYVERVLPLLDGVDYIGWRQQLYINGKRARKRTYHSLEHDRWWEDDRAWYRDISHLNPIRRELATLVDYRTVGFPDDVGWADALRATGRVRTQHFIPDPMYLYFWDSRDSVQSTVQSRRPTRPHRMSRRKLAALAQVAAETKIYVRPDISWPGFRWVE